MRKRKITFVSCKWRHGASVVITQPNIIITYISLSKSLKPICRTNIMCMHVCMNQYNVYTYMTMVRNV